MYDQLTATRGRIAKPEAKKPTVQTKQATPIVNNQVANAVAGNLGVDSVIENATTPAVTKTQKNSELARK